MANSDDCITRAALELFAAKGFEATGIRDIAEAVKLSSAALYHYIGTKDDLLYKIMCDSLDAWIVGINRACDEVEGSHNKLAAFVRLHVMYEGHYQLRSVVVDSDLRSLKGKQRSHVIALRDQYEDVLAALLRAGVADGEFDIPDPRIARLALLEMCNGVSRWYSPRGASKLGLEQIADHFSGLALALVRARKNGRLLTISDLDVPPSAYYLRLAIETSEAVATEAPSRNASFAAPADVASAKRRFGNSVG